MKYTIGLDLGGTKLNAALVNQKGKLIQQEKFLLHDDFYVKSPKKSIQNIVDRLVEASLEVKSGISKRDIIGVGLASAGPSDVRTGKLVRPANYPNWGIVPIRRLLENALKKARFAKPVSFQNDAMAAAIGEGWVGRAKGLQNYLVITVGTGIGTGLIYRGQPTQFQGAGGEWGHMVVALEHLRKSRGRQTFTPKSLYESTAEGIASGTGILRRARALGFQGETMQELVLAMNKGVVAKHKYEALFDEAATALASLCCNITLGLNVEKIFFSGGMMNVKRFFFTKMKKEYRAITRPMFLRVAPIQEAQLGNNAGVFGAARIPWLESSL